MSFPIGFGGVASGLICGLVFGFALERAGFGSATKLTAQLRFKDWAVFNVMFTAILVAAAGLYVLELAGMVDIDAIYIPSAFLWATLLGGVGVGAGMSIGGYCPGTSVVGFCSGRVDALVFFAGLIFGTFIFAGAYDYLEPMLTALPAPEAQTLPELLGVPAWVVLAALIAVAATVGVLTRPRRDAGASTKTASI